MGTSPASIFQTILGGIQGGQQLKQGQQSLDIRKQQEQLEEQREERQQHIADAEFHQHMVELGAQPIINGMVKENQDLPSLTSQLLAGTPGAGVAAQPVTASGGVPIVRKANPEATVKWKDAAGGDVAYELPSVGSQAWRHMMAIRQQTQSQGAGMAAQATEQGRLAGEAAGAPAVEMAKSRGQLAVRQAALRAEDGGIPVSDADADALGYPRGTKVLRAEIPGLRSEAEKIRQGNLKDVAPGHQLLDVSQTAPGGAAAAPGAPAAGPRVVASGGPPLATDDFGKYYLPAYAKRLGKTPDKLEPDETVKAFQDFAKDKKDPQMLDLAKQLTQLHIDTQRQQLASKGDFEVKPGTQEDRVAAQLAYGKLTFPAFNSLYSSRFNSAKKQAIFDKATEKNPNFSQAAFQMGQKFSENKQTQAQLASLENVMQAIPDLLKFSDAAKRTGVTAINKFVIPGGVAVGGKTYSNLHTAQLAAGDELSGALGFGSATDMKLKTGLDMINPSLSPENFRSNLEDVIEPFIQRKRGTLLQEMGPMGQPGMSPAADAQAAAEKRIADRNKPTLPKGDGKVIDADTAQQYMKAAGGDKAKALKMALDNGWK